MRILFVGLFLASMASLAMFGLSGFSAPSERQSAGRSAVGGSSPATMGVAQPTAPLAAAAPGDRLDGDRGRDHSAVGDLLEKVQAWLPGSQPAAGREARSQAGGTVYYQWTDARGSVHLVDSLDAVPLEWRDRAGRIEMQARKTKPLARSGTGRSGAVRAASHNEVVVYSAPWCGWCRKTLAWLDERGIAYDNRDIDANPSHRSELIGKAGRASIPVVEIDGQLVRGYNPDRMAALLGS